MMGVSDREVVRIKPEPSFGIVATTGNFYNCRITSEDLEYALVTAESQELTGDRQTSDLIPVGAGVQGGLSYEPSYAEHDWLMAAALATQVSNVLGTNGEGTGTATFTATGVTVSAGTPFAALEAGQWVRVPNAAQTGNRKLAQVLTVVGAGTGYTVASGTYVPETGTTGVLFQGARFKNASVLTSFSVERFNADMGASGLYECLRGNCVDQWSVDLAPGSILGGQFQFKGKDAVAVSTGTILPGTGVASQTYQVMNAVTNFSQLLINGVPLSGTIARKLQLTVKNNLRPREGLGVLGPFDMALGAFDCELAFEIFMNDATLYNYFVQNTPVPVSFVLADVLGNAYPITLPRTKIMSAKRPAGGRNQDIIVSGTFDALKDPVTGRSIILDRCGSAVTPWA
jgi:hypothetical protein